MNDILLTLLSLGLVVAALWTSILLYENQGATPDEIRNGIHILGGLWGVLLWFFESRWVAISICVIPLALIFLMVRTPRFLQAIPVLEKINQRVRSLLTYQDEILEGILYYALALTIITFAFWSNKLIAISAILALAFGDSLAGIVGRAYGKTSYQAPGGKKKTWVGSAAGGGAVFLAILTVYGVAAGAVSYSLIGMALIGGGVAAAAEGLSPRATDNLFVPLSVALLLVLAQIL